jgi:Protein of unknown function (DUF3800)
MIIQPQAFIDDSGSEPQSPIFIMAGFVTSAKRWASFSEEWQAALDETPTLEYFKMNEAARLQAQFSRKKGWDETKRDDRLITLTRIIKKYAEVRIHASMRNDHFEKYVKSLPVPQRKLATDSPYIMVFMQIILAMAVLGDRHGITSPCDFIFDEQGAFGKEALESWPAFKTLLEASTKSDLSRFVGSPPIFHNDKEFMPLQAADLYAWHLRQNYVQNQVLSVPANRVLRQFDRMPMIGRNYGEEEMKRLREHLLKVGEHFVAANPAIPLVHVGKTKGERKIARRRARKIKGIS